LGAIKGLQVGDIIQEIRLVGEGKSQKVNDLKDFLAIAKKIKKDQDVLLLVRKSRGSTYVLLKAKP